MVLGITSNYSPYSRAGSSGKISPSDYVNGFNTSKIQSIVIDGNDMKKLGIDEKDFSDADANGDGLISASEFLSQGMGIISVLNAFKREAMQIDGAYLQHPEKISRQNNTNNIAQSNPNQYQNRSANPVQTPNSLTHPSLANHEYLAKNLDFSA